MTNHHKDAREHQNSPHTPPHATTTRTKSDHNDVKTTKLTPHTPTRNDEDEETTNTTNTTKTKKRRTRPTNNEKRDEKATRARNERTRRREDERTRKGAVGGSPAPHSPQCRLRSGPALPGGGFFERQSWLSHARMRGIFHPHTPRSKGSCPLPNPPRHYRSSHRSSVPSSLHAHSVPSFASLPSLHSVHVGRYPPSPAAAALRLLCFPDRGAGTGFSGTQPHQLPITALGELAEQKCGQ